LLSWLGRSDIPTGSGANAPLQGNLSWFAEWQTGYGPTPPFEYIHPQKSSAALLVELIRAHPGRVTILAIGPLTNLALALQAAPQISHQVKGVICMGGSFSSQSPEFNIHCDPLAARIVFKAGWPVTLLGMEITRQMAFTRAEFASLPGDHPAICLFKEQTAGWIARVEAMGWEKDGCALHDAAAAAYLLRPDYFTSRQAVIEVSTGGELPAGTTVLKPAKNDMEHTVEVVTDVEAQKCKDLIWSYIHS